MASGIITKAPSRSISSSSAGQMLNARQTSSGSELVFRPRNLAKASILAWPNNARTVCRSPVPFRMWRALVRRSESTP